MRSAANPAWDVYQYAQAQPLTWRLFPATNGPAVATSFTGPITLGMAFKVTQPDLYLAGFWWWVCPGGGQSVSAQNFGLWLTSAFQSGAFVTGSLTASQPLTAGWNYIPYPVPLALTPDVPYRAATGLSGNFPFTSSQFNTGQPYAAGITNGPLFAYSASGATADGHGNPQCTFTTAGSDPSVNYPTTDSSSFNTWLDVQITNAVQPGVTYRIWPNYPFLASVTTDATGYTLGMEFSLDRPCALTGIWQYSPASSTTLPTRCAIWDVATQLVVPGTDNTTPSWSGAVSSGWVKCAYDATIILAANHNYKVSTFAGAGQEFFVAAVPYWSGGDIGSNGRTWGPIAAPNNANATPPGQSSWNTVTWAYPNTSTSPENDFVDVEVRPV